MKKLLVVLSLCMNTLRLFSQIQAPILVGQTTVQNAYGGLRFGESEPYAVWPRILKIYSDGLLISDTNRNRVLRFSENFTIESEIELQQIPREVDAWESYYYGGINIFTLSSGRILFQNHSFVWDWDGTKLATIEDFPTRDSWEQVVGTFRIFDRVLIKLRTGDFWSYGREDLARHDVSVHKDSATRALLTSESSWPHPGLEMDRQNRLILNGEIYTHSWSEFLRWFLEKNGTIHRRGQAVNLGISATDGLGLLEKDKPFDPSKMMGWGLPFRGRDAHGNWYWDKLVFSPNGSLIANLQQYLENFPARGSNILSFGVHPNGDFYFLHHNRGMMELYKIFNTWSPEARNAFFVGREKGLFSLPESPATSNRAPRGVVLEDEVPVRWRPSISPQSGINTTLRRGSEVVVLSRTQRKETVNHLEGYWYAIKTLEGGLGWIFGASVQVENPDGIYIGRGYFGPYREPSFRE